MTRPWTPAEEAILRDLYPTLSNPAIGERLGRSESAILNRAQLEAALDVPGLQKSVADAVRRRIKQMGAA
jgi:hypothetical protein